MATLKYFHPFNGSYHAWQRRLSFRYSRKFTQPVKDARIMTKIDATAVFLIFIL